MGPQITLAGRNSSAVSVALVEFELGLISKAGRS